MAFCTCPPAQTPPTITIDDCPVQVAQIWKFIFQRYKNGTALNEFVIASADPALLASWTTVLAASDSTLVVPGPLLSEPVTTPGDFITYGSVGGNETRGGIEIIIGTGPTLVEAKYLNANPLTIDNLDDWGCENAAVYLVDENGTIWGIADDLTTPTKFRPIPIQQGSLGISDRVLGGKSAVDSNSIRFYFAAEWDRKLYAVSPTDFDALTDIVAP